MTRILLVFGAYFTLLAGVSASQLEEQLLVCATEKDSLLRLNCFDQIAKPLSEDDPKKAIANGGSYTKMKLIDFKLDKEKLSGRKVEIKGNLAMFGSMVMLRAGLLDGEPIMVQVDGLPREQRKILLQRCNASGCSATVRGRVAPVMMDNGVVAENVVVR